jgi:adenylate cyclase
MTTGSRILVVDDTPANVKLLVDVLTAKGYAVTSAANGEEALVRIGVQQPDLVLLDIMMPGLSGYDVCRRIRANPNTALLPVVLCTSLDPKQERLNGIEAGADDFIPKPINQPELFARVKSLLRIKSLQDEVRAQAAQLAEWNVKLEDRVREQVAQMDALSRLKSFFSPQLAEAIVAGGADMLKTHRREISVVFIDLRGFTAFTDRAEPEEVMELLHQFHAAMGRIVLDHGGTLERFAGDSVMIFFNDPVPMERPAEAAVNMALVMQQGFPPLAAEWRKRGYELGLGCGIAMGYATLGQIGFEGRWDYAAIGSVTNLAARLCAEAEGGQVLVDRKIMARVEGLFGATEIGPLALKGLTHPVPAFALAPLGALPSSGHGGTGFAGPHVAPP